MDRAAERRRSHGSPWSARACTPGSACRPGSGSCSRGRSAARRRSRTTRGLAVGMSVTGLGHGMGSLQSLPMDPPSPARLYASAVGAFLVVARHRRLLLQRLVRHPGPGRGRARRARRQRLGERPARRDGSDRAARRGPSRLASTRCGSELSMSRSRSGASRSPAGTRSSACSRRAPGRTPCTWSSACSGSPRRWPRRCRS